MRMSLSMVLMAGLLLGLPALGCGPSGGDDNNDNVNDNNANNNGNGNGNTNTNANNQNNNNNNVPDGCGDGEIQFGEICDDGANNSDTVPDACRTNCQLAGCGDGVIDSGEVCDGQNLANEDCTDHGADGGTLACSATCTAFDTSGCTTCGNNACETGETLSSCPQDCGLVKVAAGGDHSCVLVGSGEVKCWGRNNYGQLGDGSTASLSTAPVTVINITDFVDLGCGSNHCCGVRSGGTVECWGNNEAGQLGNNSQIQSSSPVTVNNLTNVVQVAAGNEHSCAVKGDTTVWCWGANYSGQLGDNEASGSLSTVPVPVSGLTGATQVSCGAQHSCAVVGLSGRCWGAGGNGRLGINTSTTEPVPVMVTNSTNFALLQAGGAHTCAKLNDGSMVCWGHNHVGQLGNGTSGVDLWDPVSPSLSGTVADIAVGANHSCAVFTNGAAQCWGDGTSGQLGDASNSSADAPQTVSGSSGYGPSISSNRDHTCVLYGSSGVRCWGAGEYGQLGNGGVADSNTPVTVNGL